MRAFSFIFIAAVIALSGCVANTKSPSDTISHSVVELDSSKIFNLHSDIYNEDFRIQVRLPASYATNPEKHYPIVIKVDGQWDFLLAASAYNCLYFDGQIPEIIFIGIDWAHVEGNIHAIRSRDLLPSAVPYFEGSGYAKTFIDIIQQELVPQLEQRYRLNGQRYLLGGSWGAVFTTYALLQRPEFFDGAIAIGGGYQPFAKDFEQLIEQHANSATYQGKRLYLGVGRHDQIAPSVLQLSEQLETANLTGMQVKLDHLAGFGHSGMNVPGYAGGYQHMFQRPQVAVAEGLLQSYVGTYQSAGENPRTLVISMQNNALLAEPREGEKIPLTAQSANEFYHPGIFFNPVFQGNKLILTTFFGVEEYQKVMP